jgi:hypothetical protein
MRKPRGIPIRAPKAVAVRDTPNESKAIWVIDGSPERISWNALINPLIIMSKPLNDAPYIIPLCCIS